ncbi:MAG: bifunctional hydroxymethylpyrimidine kinase/phosphomethylpyrimidine kinase [Bacteroidaceae bacterium]|nr:bifunctional hydroxymethylpyrimidine kinase/phosphomethylpyrimidine kinase [Bacteroidaceae bacterium]
MAPILSINGSDSTGRSGIQADIKVVKDLGCYAMTAITSVTVQNSQGITMVSEMPTEVVAGQVRAVYDDCLPKAIKVGMVNGAETISRIRDEIRGCRNVVCSPVIFSSDGTRLMDDASVRAYRCLMPLTKLLVLKSQEAEIVLDMKIITDNDMVEAAKRFHEDGAEYVLLRGSCHSEGRVTALLYADGQHRFFSSYNIEGWQRHGVAGSSSMALAVRLAMGDSIELALQNAHEYLHNRLVYSVESEDYGVRPQELYNKFLSLVVQHHRTNHDVAFYADRLAITPRYLAQITRMVALKTPKQIIDGHLLQQSKSLLQNTSLSIQEISDNLGFSSPILFTRFVKQHEGVSPRELRKA